MTRVSHGSCSGSTPVPSRHSRPISSPPRCPINAINSNKGVEHPLRPWISSSTATCAIPAEVLNTSSSFDHCPFWCGFHHRPRHSHPLRRYSLPGHLHEPFNVLSTGSGHGTRHHYYHSPFIAVTWIRPSNHHYHPLYVASCWGHPSD